MICQICHGASAESHFGGFSCRACAAFFRRFVNSPKPFSICTCRNKKVNAHPCRHCRMRRCLAAGMVKCKVVEKGTRDLNISIRKLEPAPSPPLLSFLNYQIVPRESANIHHTLATWSSLEHSRNELYGGRFDDLTFFEMSCFSRRDSLLIWDFMQSIFPHLKHLDKLEKDSLRFNFAPKWGTLDPAIDYTVNQDHWQNIEKAGEWKNIVWNYYGRSIPKDKRMSKEDVLRVFGPIFHGYYENVAKEIYRRKLDRVEFIALFLLIFFDSGYTNISSECAEMCEAIRKMVLRELKGYQMECNRDEMRFFETIEALTLIEKAEKKFIEEIMICQLYNVKLDDDFLDMMTVQKL
ncbi:unnamed protein product [Caenorhabditis sp. 36 PRJEB53466]|nr:unnamed protein product [Caenorhabditis sp. 36 PRJEB53466]